jgi:simple sugar transport system permease protein
MKKPTMMGFFRWLNESETSTKVISSVVAILGGLVIGFLVMLAIDPARAAIGLWTILTGLFRDGTRSFGQTLHYSVPIILTGLSVAFAFRTGLFNIGATGQLTIGAFAAVYTGIHWTFLGPFHWGVAVLMGALAGAFWGAIPGLLKAYRNVNEVVASIMLNYIGTFLTILMIKTFIYNQELARALPPAASAHLPRLSQLITSHRSSLNFGFIIAIIIVIITHIILNKTTFGYQLKSVGFNRDASRYAGINEKRNIILAMTISGAIAGIAGAVMYLVPGRLMTIESSLLQEGFTGIAISLLGLSAPIGVFFAGLFYGALEMGGFYLQVTTRFVPQIIEIIIAVIIYFSALALFFQKYVKYFAAKKAKIEAVEVDHD